jgi:hypothetical protein
VTPSPSPRIYELPTWNGGCPGIGILATLHGDASDPDLVWLTPDTRGGGPKRYELRWYPRGYTARFNPELEVLDPDGNLIAREGDHVGGGCVVEDPRNLDRPTLGIGDPRDFDCCGNSQRPLP